MTFNLHNLNPISPKQSTLLFEEIAMDFNSRNTTTLKPINVTRQTVRNKAQTSIVKNYDILAEVLSLIFA